MNPPPPAEAPRFACRTCRDTYSVEAGRDGIGQMTYDPCPDCTAPLLTKGAGMTYDDYRGAGL